MSEMLKSQTLNQKPFGVFLLMFSIVTFHLEIFSANMTFTNQSMIIHVKYIYRRQCNVISVENILRRNKNHGTVAKKQLIFFGNLLKISTFQTYVIKPNT